MTRKLILGFVASVIIVVMFGMSNSNHSIVHAQAGTPTATNNDDFTVTMTITGVVKEITIQSVSVTIVILDDGTKVLINPATLITLTLTAGQNLTIIGSVDDTDEQIVAKEISLTLTATASATLQSTVTATLQSTIAPTSSATSVPTLSGTAVSTLSVSCVGTDNHPVAERLAKAFGVSYAEIMAWHCAGFGFGEITKAYALAAETGKDASAFFALKKSGLGWGQIKKNSNVTGTLAVDESNNGKGTNGKGKNNKGNNGKGNNGKGNNK